MKPQITTPVAFERISKILSSLQPLENAATRYLYNQCGFVPAKHHAAWKYIGRHANLTDYAHREGAHPAIIFQAVNTHTNNLALEIVYLTHDGELAPIKDPRLLLGALGGGSATMQTSDDQSQSIHIYERIEDALRATLCGVDGTIIAAFRRSNILNLPVLQSCKPVGSRRVKLWYPAGHDEAARQKWLDICAALGFRGFEVMLSQIERAPLNGDAL